MFAIIDLKTRRVIGQAHRDYVEEGKAFVRISNNLFNKFKLDPSCYEDYKVVDATGGKVDLEYRPSRSFPRSRLVEIPAVPAGVRTDIQVCMSNSKVWLQSYIPVSSVEVTGLLRGRFDSVVFNGNLSKDEVLEVNIPKLQDVRVYVTRPIDGPSYGVVFHEELNC